MKEHYKSAMDQVKADPEILDKISAKVELNNKRKFWSRKYARFAVAASIMVVAFSGFAVLTVMKSSQEEVANIEPKLVGNEEVNQTDSFVADQATIYGTVGGAEMSYAIDPMDYEEIKDTADYVFTFVPVEELSSSVDQKGWIYTTHNVEIVDSIKGEVQGNVLLQIPGGSVTVEEYYKSMDSDAANKAFPNGIEEIANQFIVSDPAKTLSLTPGQEYLAVAHYDEETGEYTLVCDVYGIYTVNGNQAVNEASGNVIQESEF